MMGKVDDWWCSNPITILLGSDDKDDEGEVQLLREAESNDAPRSVDGDRVKAIHVNSRRCRHCRRQRYAMIAAAATSYII